MVTITKVRGAQVNRRNNKCRQLKDVLAPCPVCSGTIDIDVRNYWFCHSCGARWSMTGQLKRPLLFP